MAEEIINKVAQSKIFSFDIEEFIPHSSEIIRFDLADFLYQGLVIKEMEFRTNLKNLDWTIYQGKSVLVFCSTEAIIPIWAYMLVATYLSEIDAIYANEEQELYLSALRFQINQLARENDFSNRPVIIKGCSNIPYKESLYLETTKLFLPLAKSIMYGEPCSTVPIYKKK